MSMLTCYLLLAALVLVALFFVNAVFYRRRFGTFLRPEERPGFRQPLSAQDGWLSTIGALGLLAGLAWPKVAPGSAFALWLAQPYSHLAYFAWCLLAPTIVGIAMSVLALFRAHRRPMP